ncbi:uncharacterized protein LOC134183052 [Corticium candelabrum]|uniref:uncharacterized protein LOC134183052 n=1 Tax=Corticium candelabrum TaxID=121492 RepID=UPI002E277304|nr:uncharacterized protein LOC134183052 [Corticium candelabrum]
MQHSQCNFKICDLGHAKYIGLNGLAPPCPNCGTIGFRAPEIVKREAHGFKVDVYALGVTLFNLALPFNRKQQSQRGITNCCMLQHLPFATNIIEKCCQDDVRRRPSALQLMELVSGPGQL